MEDNGKKLCPSCNILKSQDSFYRSKSREGGYERRCKICRTNKVVVRKEPKKKRTNKLTSKWEDYFRLVGVKKSDYIEMYRFLKKIGYDITLPIHEQFCFKYGLKPKKRLANYKNHYTIEELLKDI